MKLRFTPRATEDIVDIANYFSSRNPDAGRRVRAAIYECLQTILCFRILGARESSARFANSWRRATNT